MLEISCTCVSYISCNMNEKIAKKPIFGHLCKTMKREGMKLSAFSLIVNISNILKKEMYSLCINTSTRTPVDFTKNAYFIPTKTFKTNVHVGGTPKC